LWLISKKQTKYFEIYESGSSETRALFHPLAPKDLDYLVERIIGTKAIYYDYTDQFNSMSMYEFLDFLISDAKYNERRPGEHINYFTYEKISKMLKQAGYDFVIRSKYTRSCVAEMRDHHTFDYTWLRESLYVEAIK
jgi:hypothetical protein